MITFTGSRAVGENITRKAGLKKLTMELGSNSPLVVMPDADPAKVATAIAAAGYANAGQSCISTQRVIVHRNVYQDVLDALVPAVSGLSAGDPMLESTNVGPLVREADAERVASWISDARSGGARVLVGGERTGSLIAPAVLADVKPDMDVSCQELFGPAVAVTPASGMDEALAMANDTNYGLSAGIFTESITDAMRFALEVESGNVNINGGTSFRADMMPYGGVKDSGFGREGPSYAVEEMTELKMVIFHGVKK
jgi:acyl-CoA reductase-like NAD-dependent aldehyde dehydrogenase